MRRDRRPERSVGVRDSKAPEAGHLTLRRESFAALLSRLGARF
ncbi:MAG TPA: DUF397 domain-containing protein [Spirillospora sp.]